VKLQGSVFKNEKTGSYWAVVIPALGIHTQGKTKKEAYEMAKDAVETVIDKKGFSVAVQAINDSEFSITPNNPKILMAAVLKRMRIQHNMTAQSLADRLGEKSVNGVLRYEQGKSMPSLQKLSDILSAIDPSLDPVLKIG